MTVALFKLIRLMRLESERLNRQMSIPEMRFVIGGVHRQLLPEFDALIVSMGWQEFPQ